MEPETHQNTLAGIGSKNPTIHVLDALMGMGKSTAIIEMIRTEIRADLTIHGTSLSNIKTKPSEHTEKTGGLDTVPTGSWGFARRRWLIIVPTLDECRRYRDQCSVFGDSFECPDGDRYSTKTLHLQNLVEDGRNIVATHALFKQLSRDVYKAIEAQNYTLVIDEEIEVVRPHDMTKRQVDKMFEEEMVFLDPASRRLTWNERRWGKETRPFQSPVPKLCEAGHLVLTGEGLLIIETPAEFLRCFEEVWIATYMFHGAPLRAYLKMHHFPINHLTVAKDARTERRHVGPFGAVSDDELSIKRELRALVTVYRGSRNQSYRRFLVMA
jgi:hypothetical protein